MLLSEKMVFLFTKPQGEILWSLIKKCVFKVAQGKAKNEIFRTGLVQKKSIPMNAQVGTVNVQKMQSNFIKKTRSNYLAPNVKVSAIN